MSQTKTCSCRTKDANNSMYVMVKVKVSTFHAMKTYRVNISIAPLTLTSAVGGNEWSASRPGQFTPEKSPLYPLNGRVCGPQSRY